MKTKIDVTIWDSSPERLREIEANLNSAAQQYGIILNITVMTEIPLLGRNNMLGRIPVLEIDFCQWTLRPYEPFSITECTVLLQSVIFKTTRG